MMRVYVGVGCMELWQGSYYKLLIILPSVRVYFDSDAKHKFSFILSGP